MNNKIKIMTLMLLINSLAFAGSVNKNNAELSVTGEGVKERIDYTLYSKELTTEDEKKENMILNGTSNGKKSATHAVYADKGSYVHNIGKILSYDESLETHLGGLVIMGIVNPLKRDDALIALRGREKRGDEKEIITKFRNDGLIKMGGFYQDIRVGNIAGLIPTSVTYADYERNIIDASYADIENNGTITNGMDSVTYLKALDVGILNGFYINYKKNAVLLDNGKIENKGLIEYNRDKKFVLTNGVAVDLLQIGVEYNRTKTGINATDSKVINSGKIFIGGDILPKGNYSGIGVSALGADLRGTHEKYGVMLNGKESVFINTGEIEIERDFKKALDDNNNILDLYLIYQNVLKLGLLAFTNLKEASIGAQINEGTFYNNGGTISVGVNDNKHFATQLRKAAAVAVAGDKEAKIYFNTPVPDPEKPDSKPEEEVIGTSIINLEGKNVYAVWLENNSNVIFNGTTEINFNPPEGLDEKDLADYYENRNKDIFYTDATSGIKIKGTLKVNGDFTLNNNMFDMGDNVVKRPLPNGEGYEIVVTPGKLVSTGTIGLNGDVKLDSANFIGMSEKDLESYLNHKYIEAEKGIEGEGNLVSNSYLFDIKTDKTDNSISLTDVDRKDFNDIVLNKELGNIFETSYDGANEAQLAVYRLLAQGENQESFNKVVDEVTGKDTLTTLPAQIYDITRDLNGQFKDFAKNNRADGVVFKYINSKSELDANSSTVGFDRKSSGIMVGYNNNLSEKLRLGAGFSYMTSDIDYTSNSKNKVTTWNARGYSDYNLGFANIFNDLSFAYNQSENKRMADQLSYTGMKESDTDVYTLSLNNSLYKEYKFGDKLTLVPSLNLDFTYIWQDAIEEDGAIGVSAKEVEAFYGTLGAGVDGKYNLLTLDNSKLNLVGGIDYAYDIIRETDDMSLQVSAFDPYYKEDLRELDKKYLDLNIGLNYEYKDSYSVGVKYTKELINDVDNDQFAVDFTYKF